MKLNELIFIMSGGCWQGRNRTNSVLPRYAAMCGLHIDPRHVEYDRDAQHQVEIPMETVVRILEIDAKERAGDKLAELGQGLAKIPSSISHSISGSIDLLLKRTVA